MRTKNSLFLIAVTGLLSVSLGLAFLNAQESNKKVPETPAAAQPNDEPTDAASEDQFVPIDNMHHFMEYVCEPSYKSLKEFMVKEPENRRAWKTFKNHALVLAETSALVATRVPEDQIEKSKQWKQLSLDVYQSGAALYKSSGKFEQAKKHYGLMIDSCNKCHTAFAEGKHQLEK